MKCAVGQDSVGGSADCTICDAQYYRPSATSLAVDCVPCGTLRGVRCDSKNSTTATLHVTAGYWRHSTATTQTYLCERTGTRSPCLGGADAGADGDGYCAAHHHGPRCELCSQANHYFDADDARCKSCGDVAARSVAAAVLVMCLLATIGGVVAAVKSSRPVRTNVLSRVIKQLRRLDVLWYAAGMQCKVKLGFGVWQCASATPATFGLRLPAGADDLKAPLRLVALPSSLGVDLILPGSCYGSFRSRLLVNAFWPFVLIAVTALCMIVRELSHNATSAPGVVAAARRAVQKTLPAVLILTFILLPSQSTRILKTRAS